MIIVRQFLLSAGDYSKYIYRPSHARYMANFLGPLLAGLAGPAISGISTLINRRRDTPTGGRIRRRHRLHRGHGIGSSGFIPSQRGVMFTASRALGSGLIRRRHRIRHGGMVMRRRGYGLAVMHKWPLISRPKMYAIGGRIRRHRRMRQPKLSSVMRGSGVVGLTHKVRGHMKHTAYGRHYVRPHYSINTSHLGYGIVRRRRRVHRGYGIVRHTYGGRLHPRRRRRGYGLVRVI